METIKSLLLNLTQGNSITDHGRGGSTADYPPGSVSDAVLDTELPPVHVQQPAPPHI